MAKVFNLPDNFKLSSPKTWFRIAQPVGNSTQLSRKHIYILPTRFGLLYAFILIALLLGSINYALSLGFAITFLLVGLGTLSMLHTWRNLANLKVVMRRANPVFAGEVATFELIAIEESIRSRYAISAKFANLGTGFQTVTDAKYSDIEALNEGVFNLVLPSKKRGWLKAPRVVFATEFPVSFFHVWAYAEVDSHCLIYPSPSLRSQINPSSNEQGYKGNQPTPQGDDDFVGHRNYQFGDSPKRVDWKASSREQGLLTKQFQGEATSTLWLDFAATTGDNIELRVSQLTRWVIDAETGNLKYGLRLPQLSINPNAGEVHYHQCLAALALM